MKKENMPAITIKDITDPATAAVRQLRYRTGKPRSYRFDASKGVININGEETITKAGDHFSFIPIAWRIFRDNLFTKGKKDWAELFFINQQGILSTIMVHQYSVEALASVESELYYDDLILEEVVLTLKPVQKEKKAGEGQGNKYYIAQWGYEPADAQVVAEMKKMTEGLMIYRSETITSGAELIISHNFHQPETLTITETAEAAA
jgi:hypothetical protein